MIKLGTRHLEVEDLYAIEASRHEFNIRGHHTSIRISGRYDLSLSLTGEGQGFMVTAVPKKDPGILEKSIIRRRFIILEASNKEIAIRTREQELLFRRPLSDYSWVLVKSYEGWTPDRIKEES